MNVITTPCEEGVVEATRDSNDRMMWTIGYPWFDERFHGSPIEVMAHMKRTVRDVQKNDETSPPHVAGT